MIKYYPNYCPFCGASRDNFITAEVCTQNYKVIGTKVNNKITCLNSYPKLGLENSAYSIDIGDKYIWIDCPSTFKNDLELMDKILFTHHHFLGASNLYRAHYTAFLWIHKKDSENNLAKMHPFDKKFKQNFTLSGIEAFHIDGHTPGFTIYIFEDVLFICDYLIPRNNGFIFNPFGPSKSTSDSAIIIKEIIEDRNLNKVCGYNYVMDFPNWKEIFEILLNIKC